MQQALLLVASSTSARYHVTVRHTRRGMHAWPGLTHLWGWRRRHRRGPPAQQHARGAWRSRRAGLLGLRPQAGLRTQVRSGAGAELQLARHQHRHPCQGACAHACTAAAQGRRVHGPCASARARAHARMCMCLKGRLRAYHSCMLFNHDHAWAPPAMLLSGMKGLLCSHACTHACMPRHASYGRVLPQWRGTSTSTS